jgi:Rps23 Pro-64 3,4-dihydroxylase Tpa1-like proline 4-hydroxylase
MNYIKRGSPGQDFSNYESTESSKAFQFEVTAEKLNNFYSNWQKNKLINWDNFLPNTTAEEIYNHYFHKDKDNWDLIIHPDINFSYKNDGTSDEYNLYHMYLTKDNDPTISERTLNAREYVNNGVFSYKYRRTEEFHPYLKWFSSPKFISILEQMTGYKNLTYHDQNCFVSCYESGHWNGPHSDGNNGRIAFVYHLTKDWLPCYGGLFMKMDTSLKNVIKTITPSFNNLTLFDVHDHNAPHLVSEIVEGVTNKRIGFTGWYM